MTLSDSVLNLIDTYQDEIGIYPDVIEIDRKLYAQLNLIQDDNIKYFHGVDYYSGLKVVLTDSPHVRVYCYH